uniref:uncharacterized protein LOC131134966 n=1 Tax=Doryrhamphus excisus TaxID=161450 RepID=UPI0025AE4248|nr:uncharacterized protein LOC131134966 [Doryrhamphus excisus]
MSDPGDFDELFSFIKKRITAIHRSPSNAYEQHINVYCFVHSERKRKDAVAAGQAAWKGSKSKESSRADLFRSAVAKMEKIKTKPTIMNVFASSAANKQNTEDKEPAQPRCGASTDGPNPVAATASTPTPVALTDESARVKRSEENEVRACAFLCTSLGVTSGKLLTEDVTTHPEFTRALTSIASSHFTYSPLLKQWEGSAYFKKSKSQVSTAVSEAKLQIKNLRDELIELSDMTTVSKNLATQLQSCQQKMNKMLAMLPTFFSVKEAIEKAIPLLQACVRSQKQRKFNKLTGQTMYKLSGDVTR